MKRIIVSLTAAIAALACALFVCSCAKSSAPVVGTYKLVSVTMTNGITQPNSYVADGSDPFVSENSLVLKIKSDYKWHMSIRLPGITDTEDGTWKDNDGVYTLVEDRDDPEIPLTYTETDDGATVEFVFSEDGYMLSLILKKI